MPLVLLLRTLLPLVLVAVVECRRRSVSWFAPFFLVRALGHHSLSSRRCRVSLPLLCGSRRCLLRPLPPGTRPRARWEEGHRRRSIKRGRGGQPDEESERVPGHRGGLEAPPRSSRGTLRFDPRSLYFELVPMGEVPGASSRDAARIEAWAGAPHSVAPRPNSCGGTAPGVGAARRGADYGADGAIGLRSGKITGCWVGWQVYTPPTAVGIVQQHAVSSHTHCVRAGV